MSHALTDPIVVGSPAEGGGEPERCAVLVRGVVQGVGFRPFVFGLATRLNLGGFVLNRPDGVLIEIEGQPSGVAVFLEQLQTDCPTIASIEALEVSRATARGQRSFAIEPSRTSGEPPARFFSPDVSTCEECLAELLDPLARRYRYPFINCASCGPRLTIVRQAPYDRARTTMAAFTMCSSCRAEYEDPADRRFHAQPIACADCGPQLAVRDKDGCELRVDALAHCRDLLLSDGIVAIKGLGGYHLACDATSDVATSKLRARKHREARALAVLVADIAAAQRLCHVSAEEAALLRSPRRPIVLLRRLQEARIASAVAPNNPLLGLMLPYTPLHHLLVREGGRPLVLTSGNRSDEPIAFRDDEALERLRGIADGFLSHDRPIHLRCDDSVARVMGGAPRVLRRSRGYAPEPIRLPMNCVQPILALGGQLKSAFALGRREQAFVSHHHGDLHDFNAFGSFRDGVAHYESLFAFEPAVLAHDLHPEYATTEYALKRQAEAPSPLRLVGVQHHHAHMASCMVENGLTCPVIAVTFDGTGYGSDGSLWGGEFLVGDYRRFRRAAHLRAVALPGGEQAIREPWRMAVAHLLDCGQPPEPFVPSGRRGSLRVLRRMIDKGLNSPLTSSAGRLFDAVAALLGLHQEVTFEGQAAMALEWLAGGSDTNDVYPFELEPDLVGGGLVVDTRPFVLAVSDAIRRAQPGAHVARQFHNTLAQIIGQVTARLGRGTGIHDVVLTGGVFQNALLLETATQRLESLGLRVHSHARVPANDGGLALGQLAVAAAVLQESG